MNELTVKQLKDMIENPIEVYTPTKKINCTSIKFQNRYYKYSTNADERVIEFIQTTTNDELETVIQVYTK
jgi:hypothetical protein